VRASAPGWSTARGEASKDGTGERPLLRRCSATGTAHAPSPALAARLPSASHLLAPSRRRRLTPITIGSLGLLRPNPSCSPLPSDPDATPPAPGAPLPSDPDATPPAPGA
jgi:hypothetical protein